MVEADCYGLDLTFLRDGIGCSTNSDAFTIAQALANQNRGFVAEESAHRCV